MPASPQWTSDGAASDIMPGASIATNESWPVFAGYSEPGSTVKFDIDGTEYTVPVDENGAWDFVPPQALDNGDHSFEMWAEKGGERSDSVEWDANVDADSVARQNDYSRVQEWRNSGSSAHHERYRPQTGGGGGGSESATSVGPQPGTSTPVGGGGGFEKGSGAAAAVGTQTQGQPQGVEKGNQAPCPICGEPRGDASPCPTCGMD